MTKATRVLVITNYFPPHYMGGAEVSAYNTCLGLLERGLQISVLVVNARARERIDRQCILQNIPVHRFICQSPWPNPPLVQAFDPRIYRAVRAEILRLQPDLVHVHNVSGATLAPLLACRQHDIPTVLTLHDYWLLCPNNMLYRGNGSLCDPGKEPHGCHQCFRRHDFWADIPRRRRVFAQLVQHVQLFVSPSQRLVDLHVAAGYDRRRFRVVPYGIYPGASRGLGDPLLREYVQARASYHTLLFAGTVVEQKGLQTLIDALPLMNKYVDRFRLFVAGWGSERFLSVLRRTDPLTVKLLGRLPFEEMRSLYAAADLTVVPSIWYDNSPMVIYESLLAGTPVLGSDIGGIPELIQTQETGYVLPPGDALALAEGLIQHYSRSAPERRAMRHCCIEYAHTHLTMDHHLDRILGVYDSALGN